MNWKLCIEYGVNIYQKHEMDVLNLWNFGNEEMKQRRNAETQEETKKRRNGETKKAKPRHFETFYFHAREFPPQHADPQAYINYI